jgi:hypothetical protein
MRSYLRGCCGEQVQRANHGLSGTDPLAPRVKTDVYCRVAAFAFLKDTVREWLDR